MLNWPLASISISHQAFSKPPKRVKFAPRQFCVLGAFIVSAFLAMQPAQAQPKSELAESLALVRAHDQRLQDIGWKLVSANAAYCTNRKQSIGLQLVDVMAYDKPDDVRAALELSGDFAIDTIAANSPAADASLAQLDTIVAINSVRVDDWPAEPKPDWKRQARAHAAIDASLEAENEVSLSLDGGREVKVAGLTVCASRFELGGANKRALADGERVILGRKFPGFAYPEDELAAAIAHELSHNILSHRTWLDAQGRKRKHVRLTEREADRLMPWLLANAGYDPDAASRFMARWGPNHGGGLLRKRTHDGWDERVELINTEITQIRDLENLGEPPDWSVHFKRDTDTE